MGTRACARDGRARGRPWPGLVPAGPAAPGTLPAPGRLAGRLDRPAGATFDWPANHPIRCRSGTERRRGEKRPGKVVGAGRDDGLLTVLARVWAGTRRGHGMDSVTRGSGIALSVLVAATASILLLLPGKPADSWRGPGTPGRVVMASAAATSTSGQPGPGSQPSASSRAGGQPAAGPRPGCRAAGAHSGRARAGLTSRPALARPGRGRPGPDHAVRPERTVTRTSSGRLSRYREIRPDLP